ncbi:glycosyltransferase family 2 protein [uncultured Tistrella sp.]|uniref:glycosyltransferase n=1 Tax=Tistrella mobilis TaxID=171437 RepID=UPI000C0A84AE|nr:glycosyltransferase family 2 protein [uncultured Tistrella sp.]MAM74528.1 glycosyltransferase [Tistrella sp.]|tara:strand:+ start:499 stop:1539 length:1041 start_codon:yes stop_codon:yes gene_type:complete
MTETHTDVAPSGMAQDQTINVFVITYKATHLLPKCLPNLLNSTIKARIIVVNSSSNDGTVEMAQEMGAETFVVPRKSFNHALTRELARRTFPSDIAVMVTPDAFPTGPDVIEKLTAPIREGKAAVSYARQIPHVGAGFFEAFPREFNYPAVNEIRSIEDLKRYGAYTFYCSNSCSAWRNSALDAVGGFGVSLVSEDFIGVAKLLRNGEKVAYVGDAVVHHSHTYTLKQEFQRMFDTGYERYWQRHLLLDGVSEDARGKLFVKAMIARLWKERPVAIPYAIVQTGAKYIGYKLGFAAHKLPKSWIPKISSQDFYWGSEAFQKREAVEWNWDLAATPSPASTGRPGSA